MKKFFTGEFELAGVMLRDKIIESRISYQDIYGVPRGGVPLAIRLSHLLGIPLTDVLSSNTLIVDDIVATGKTRERFKDNDFACIHIKSHLICEHEGYPTYYVFNTEDWIEYFWEKNEKPLADDITRILEYIGENPTREGLIDTPKRVVDMYDEIFRGYKDEPPKITCFERKKPGSLILDKGYFFSMCEHHMLPFFGEYYFGYIPRQNEIAEIGASKIARTVDYYAARLQTAERLCSQVLERIEEVASPIGSILIMSARHLCKEMRGVKKYNSPFETIEARGVLLENSNGCKDEFLSRINLRI